MSTVGWAGLMDVDWEHRGRHHLCRGVRDDGVLMAGGRGCRADAPGLTRDILTGDWRKEGM